VPRLATAALLTAALSLIPLPLLAQARRPPPIKQVPLQIECLLDGASVFLDGLPVGTTPLDQPLLVEPGEYTVRVTRRGYSDFYDTVQVKRTPVTVQVDLLPVRGVLTLHTTPPQARISVNAVFLGLTPFDGEVDSGDLTLHLTLQGYHQHEQLLRVVAGEQYDLNIALQPLPPPEEPFYQTWWFWTGVGALTLGAVITSALLLQEDAPAPTYPQLQLP
jgi:hypothetical protein